VNKEVKTMKKFLLAGAAIFAASPALPQANINGVGNFTPSYGQNKTISATTTSTSVTWTGAGITDPDMLVLNTGTVVVFFRCGVGAQTATSADAPIPGGGYFTFEKGNKADTCAFLAASTTATVYAITGFGS
jgi:hypothetical protein